jgi:hypothetical protein
MPVLSDQQITNALLDAGGILAAAARHLTEQLGRPISRQMLSDRLESSRVLRAVQQIAEQRAIERSIAAAKQRQKDRRSASMKAAWVTRRQGQAGAGEGSDDVGDVDDPNARARTRTSRALTPAIVQAERDRRLCCAKTRKGTPCVRRVVAGRDRCSSHGGKSTGPRTPEGKARVAAASRARWARYRQERQERATP